MAGKGAFRFDWRGMKWVELVLKRAAEPALVEFGLTTETAAKSKLRPSPRFPDGKYIPFKGTGKRTGTLQRSVHLASGDYDFSRDSGGITSDLSAIITVTPTDDGSKMTVSLGSGVEYAIYVHQNHYDPEVKHFLLRAILEQSSNFERIFFKHVEKL